MLSNTIIILAAIAATAVWISPEALAFCLVKLRGRRDYILAGRDAQKIGEALMSRDCNGAA